MTDTDRRFAEIEARLSRIEAALARDPEPAAAQSAPGAAPAPPQAPKTGPGRSRRSPTPNIDLSATKLMAWGASLAFILAAAYFVKLVYDAGWLTPERQIGAAVLAGLGLIAGGLTLARVDRDYAAYMPAVGVVVLYLAIFAAHVFYRLLGFHTAIAGVAVVTFTALWLGRRFGNSAYSLLAVVGAYLTPLLVESSRANVIDLVIYFSAWSLLFSFIGLQEKYRHTYLLALFFALFGFDIAFRMTDQGDWAIAAAYQFVQFLIFATTAAIYSIKHQRPMEGGEAIVHGLALFYFYVIQYVLLKEHTPDLAPMIALASVAVVFILYLAARNVFPDPESVRAGAILVSTYCSVVTAHVVFFELMPEEWHAWAALLLPIALGLAQQRMAKLGGAAVPVLLVAALLFGIGFLQALGADPRGVDVTLPGYLLFLYAASLYAAYWIFRRRPEAYLSAPVPLYAGHVALLTATVRVLDDPVAISITWAISAIVLLVYAVRLGDRMVGQSSLVIFAASGLKVLLYDLSDTAPFVRVLTLVVLAASLYAGGWLYQQMSGGDEKYHPNPQVNEQLNLIRRLVQEGNDEEEIARDLQRRRIPRLGAEGGWTPELIAQIQRDYGFA